MQLLEILSCSTQLKTIDDLYNRLDLIVDLARDDVKKIAKSKQIYFFDFDTVYGQATDTLKLQLKKTHLRGIQRFFECENIEQAINWLLSRLLNNMKNLSTNRAYLDYVDMEMFKKEAIEIQSFIEFKIDNELMYADINKLPREAIRGGLEKIYNDVLFDYDFDLQDFEELCTQYHFEAIDIIGYDPHQTANTKVELTASGNSQLTLFFDPNTEKENKK